MATVQIKKIMTLSPNLCDRVADYRFRHRFVSEAAAFRDLLEKGLAATAAEKNNGAERLEA